METTIANIGVALGYDKNLLLETDEHGNEKPFAQDLTVAAQFLG